LNKISRLLLGPVQITVRRLPSPPHWKSNQPSPLLRESSGKQIQKRRFELHWLQEDVARNLGVRGYCENKIKGDFVIKPDGPYDLAVNQQPDGTFGLTADLWQGHVAKEVGKDYGKLLQFYGVHQATMEARKRNLSVFRRQKQDRSIKLILMGASI
jgi:Protein of unknown function (DUF1257)